MKTKAYENGRRQSAQYCHDHSSTQCAKICLQNVSILLQDARNYPDLVNRLHVQTRLMCNFGLNRGVPWLFGTMGLIL